MDADQDFRSLRGMSPLPDLMNDPAYATNTDSKGKGIDEPDTCRICRGEGSEEEQLFYPCKCSGSIKFVHQSCLMEWLSHSQKKYCELCKTPFRFTKLYDPGMPSKLPAPIFIRELAIHGLRSLVTWLRLVLVAFVWLGWLPWSMRAIWRVLFWLADGRWPNNNFVQTPLPTANQSDVHASIATGRTLSSDAATSSATHIAVLSPVSSILNLSNEEPLGFSVAKRILLKILLPTLSTSSGDNASQASSLPSGRVRQPSWLSNVTFLNSLTPSPTVNNIVIDTLEGQLITLLVVVSFILVFLIREWVVQQQPAVNIAEDEREAAMRLMAENRNQPEAAPPAPLEARDMPVQVADDNPDLAQVDYERGVQDYAINDDESRASSTLSSPRLLPVDSRPTIQMRTSSSRPTLRSRNALDDASNIRRTIEETVNEPSSHTWPGIETFKDLWLRGDGNPDEILRIIQEEGREDELSWVVNAMMTLKQNNASRGTSSGNFDFSDHHEEAPLEGPSESASNRHANPELLHNASSESSYEILESTAPPENLPSGTSQADSFELPQETINWSEGDVETAFERMTAPETAPLSEVQEVQVPLVEFHSEVATAAVPDSGDRQPQQNITDTPQTFINRVFDWFWGELEAPQAPDANVQDVEHVVEDPALEAPFIPAPNRQNEAADAPAPNPWREPVAPQGDNRDANDIDAVEEGDDFEGILELIGIQGPIFGLLQNGVFCALLISFTIAVGIWLPYLWGKIALVFFTSPVRLVIRVPLAMLSITADVVVDSLIGSVGYVLYVVSFITRNLLRPVAGIIPFLDRVSQGTSFTQTSLTLIDGSSQRLKRVLGGFFDFQDSDLPMFSVLAHQALRIHEARIVIIVRMVFDGVKLILYDIPIKLLSSDDRNGLLAAVSSIDMAAILAGVKAQLISLSGFLLSLFGPSEMGNDSAVLIRPDYELARWDTKDRTIAIVIGYVFASLLGIFYLRVTGFFAGANRGQRPEGVVAEILNQAGGVMKVILIIGIEMLVFPLYSGLLLDLALMPLFENATLASRVTFTMSSPLTSLFVHWFIGTCYMFHFALFVSMCRKIMRTGVLYFIRDPDDPNFHPVRDVLERDIITQLRKIAFSALVYGGLVVICLGAVVWGLAYSSDGVLPIHWSSNTPMLEFPADLLFYNFVMPVILRAIKPSDGLHRMYDWWFHKCARFLRLSQFLLGERRKDEEGRSVGRTWSDILFGNKGDVENPITTDEDQEEVEEKGKGIRFLRDGKFVRAPASDQVRIPKGIKVFLEVTEDNERADGNTDNDEGLHGKKSDMFTQVYIPPNFRLRIFVFIFMIWVFAAVTGVGVTIVPLVVGRRILSYFFPQVTRMNDIYAFSVGMSILLSAGYTVVYMRVGYQKLQNGLQPMLSNPEQVVIEAAGFVLHAVRLLYLAATFVLLIPSLCALLTELYVLVPIHTYINGQQAHVIHFVQDWALGVLYVQMAYMFLQWRSNSRPAVALRMIVNDGWLRPNTALATRALILPAVIFTFLAVSLPLGFGLIAKATAFPDNATVTQSTVYRYSYPATLVACLSIYALYLLRRQIDVWRANIRDEVYLIGERLHNFGEKRARDVTGVGRRVSTS
ncbi:RING finger membrane protein [Talaromyces stipitatus ATCC 10500]|uniref:RING-type E3 ubiquitin transferase n=1 Tax=Talaromyces stipitatus (strain ATCC 10500 / CBS 375.48 / QM 6759 / NRRL 1006) TaxID=441959 RepID=B8M2I4_TALSN|nr:RING finger membrane protein [Talaromyces stipitatus ATCC 10500]EED21895.1 RING finger membrane protein [Talaromyces stipitatus ATCC 10500]